MTLSPFIGVSWKKKRERKSPDAASADGNCEGIIIMKQMANKNIVVINSLENVIKSDDVEIIEAELKTAGIELKVIESPPKAINGVEIFFPQIKVLLSDPIVYDIACGVAGSAIFSAITGMSKQLWKVICRKGLSVIKKHEIHENVAPNIHLIAGKFHAVLPAGISEKEYEKFIDGFISAINRNTIEKENYYIYDPETKQTAIYSKGKLVEIVSGGKYLCNE